MLHDDFQLITSFFWLPANIPCTRHIYYYDIFAQYWITLQGEWTTIGRTPIIHRDTSRTAIQQATTCMLQSRWRAQQRRFGGANLAARCGCSVWWWCIRPRILFRKYTLIHWREVYKVWPLLFRGFFHDKFYFLVWEKMYQWDFNCKKKTTATFPLPSTFV